ncbi:MAG: M20 family metallopeptidase [Candidatus Hermodarchaeota archaeon]
MLNLNEIFKVVDKLDSEEIMDIMKSLICINTSVPPANTYREYVDAIKPYFKQLDYSLEEVIVPEGLVQQIPQPLEGPRINLVATKDFGQKNYVSFYGHMDVVPAPEEGSQKWRHPPFQATLTKNGRIYGRGVADMKGAMASLIIALKLIKKMNLTPKYNIRVLNCTDEEIGAYPGIRYLAEQGYVKGVVFCMELFVTPLIPIGLNGCLDVIIETFGKSCHSGENYLGVNALEEMIPILNELMELKKRVEMRSSKNIPSSRRTESGDQINLTPMFNLDIIHSGIKSNIVPDYCTLTINRRYLPDESFEEVKNEIKEAIKRATAKSKAIDVKVTYFLLYPPVKANPNGPNVSKMKRVISLVQNIDEEKIPISGFSGSTDMGFVTDILDTDDIIVHGLMTFNSNYHAINEYIKIKDVKMYIKELIVFLCADI